MKKDLFSPVWDSLKLWTKESPRLFALCIIVFSCHLAFLLYSYIHPAPKLDPHRKKLTVKTHVVSEETLVHGLRPHHIRATALAQAQDKVKKTTAIKPSDPVKKTTAKAPIKKKPAPSTAKNQVVENKKTPGNEKAKKVLQELKEGLSKIEMQREVPLSSSLNVPQSIPALKADAYQILSENSDQESVAYKEILMNYLKDNLHLPGYGTVKISLTLSSQGVIKELVVLSSDSEINRFYLETSLADLSFPFFTEELSHKKEHAFCLVFRSHE